MPATTPRPPSSEQVAAFDRNAWPRSIGILGRNRRNPHAANIEAGPVAHQSADFDEVTTAVKAKAFERFVMTITE
jgi:hypothetical protein